MMLLYFGFLVLVLLVGWSLIFARGYPLFKALSVSGLTFLAVTLYYGLGTLLGWPAHYQNVPKEFQVKWAVVKPPSATMPDGCIYLWLSPLGEYESPSFDLYDGSRKSPRSFWMPFSEQTKKATQEAKQRIKKGKPVYGTKKQLMRAAKGETGFSKGEKGKGQQGTKGKVKNGEKGKKGSAGKSWKGWKDIFKYKLPEVEYENKD